ncbi:hypothetical protein OROMI_026904 [Orobanche minor]
MKGAKYHAGFAGNIARCVNRQYTNLYGLKIHDTHILLQRLFPVFIRLPSPSGYGAVSSVGIILPEGMHTGSEEI